MGFYTAFYDFEEPTLQTVDYVFAAKIVADPYENWTFASAVPGTTGFSPTNPASLILAAVGRPAYVSGWGRKAITNGDLNKFAYLGQYFDKAFKADTNGYATTNETGVLSEFGEFFPTEPGSVILTTKPDIETGEVGQALVNVISLNVDANHDGTMDRTFAGPDTTSAQRPFRFWINNDNDGGQLGAESLGGVPDNADNQIYSVRDLEDFARLWISGVPALSSFDGYEISFSWQNYSGSPAIRIFQSLEADGGNLYLTDTNVAWSYVQSQNPFAIGTVTAGASMNMPLNYFAQAGRKHLVFEGVSVGKGELILTISRSGTVLAKTSTHLELKDIRDFYERGYVFGIQHLHPEMRDYTNATVFGVEERLAPAPDETKHLIVYVHGFNNAYEQFRSYAETFYKRLYWQGYRGRYAALRWPTRTGFFPLSTYNESEYIAFRSAAGASAYFANLRTRFPDYSINVGAHSMGNIVMMETLKLDLALGRQNINNYVLMEAAVPAQCYDANVATHDLLTLTELSRPTPNTYQLYPGAIQNALLGNMANFYSQADFALGNWLVNQVLAKPSFHYDMVAGLPVFERVPYLYESVTDPRELMAFVARPRTKTVGAQPNVGGIIAGNTFNLESALGFENTIADHSGQFTRTVQSVHEFYVELLERFFP